MKRFFF